MGQEKGEESDDHILADWLITETIVVVHLPV